MKVIVTIFVLVATSLTAFAGSYSLKVNHIINSTQALKFFNDTLNWNVNERGLFDLMSHVSDTTKITNILYKKSQTNGKLALLVFGEYSFFNTKNSSAKILITDQFRLANTIHNICIITEELAASYHLSLFEVGQLLTNPDSSIVCEAPSVTFKNGAFNPVESRATELNLSFLN